MQPPPIGLALRRRPPRCCSIPAAKTPSGTAREVPLADVLQEPLRGLLHQVQHALETVRTTVVGVRDLPLGRVGEVQEGSDHSPTTTEGTDCPVVLLVHGDDVIEGLAVLGPELARPLGAYVEAPE